MRSFSWMIVAGVIAFAGSQCPVSGQTVTVIYHAGTSTVTQTWPTSVTIPIVVGNQHDYVEVYCSSSSANLGELDVTADVNPPATNVVWILVTRDGLTTPSDISNGNLAAANWEGLQDSRGNLKIRAGIGQNLTGSIILESTSDLPNLRVNGTISAPVQIGNHGNTTEIRAGSVGSNGDITRTTGQISLVNVTNGDMLGDVKATNGSIGIIDVTAGNIGASG